VVNRDTAAMPESEISGSLMLVLELLLGIVFKNLGFFII